MKRKRKRWNEPCARSSRGAATPQSREHKASLRESAKTWSTMSPRSNVPYTNSRNRSLNHRRLRRRHRCKCRHRRRRRIRRRFALPHPRRGLRSQRACSPREEEAGLRALRVRRLRSAPSSLRRVRAAPSPLKRRARSPRCSSRCAFRCPSCTITSRRRPPCGPGRERGRRRVCTCSALGCVGVSLSVVGRAARCLLLGCRRGRHGLDWLETTCRMLVLVILRLNSRSVD